MKSGKGKIYRSGKAATLFLSIPAKLATDSTFPFAENDVVTVEVKGDKLEVKKP